MVKKSQILPVPLAWLNSEHLPSAFVLVTGSPKQRKLKSISLRPLWVTTTRRYGRRLIGRRLLWESRVPLIVNYKAWRHYRYRCLAGSHWRIVGNGAPIAGDGEGWGRGVWCSCHVTGSRADSEGRGGRLFAADRQLELDGWFSRDPRHRKRDATTVDDAQRHLHRHYDRGRIHCSTIFTLWRLLLPYLYGYSYKASCARPG